MISSMDRRVIGDRIKQYREAAELTREQLARRLEVSSIAVYSWERDEVDKRRIPDRLRLPHIARALGVKVADLTADLAEAPTDSTEGAPPE